ncbi:DnaQ-like (or DEDD) 3'-5' exonuclease superfamily protein [Metarhizium robertsii]|uniref:Ribonuclease H-like protein n=2 Tax=Metarhizium robertsii TaxID=568076 RepID=E9F603_METRA|nr:Ribonuclease H-like protein [Metarhizium robertsii ARSEF 23]EFY96889.1 Ribonuclease H-like protein [Metarhizium robertsii ARSEF 23]EXU99904.1 DnaQ-like (or DEDD) 3'-5' exonuclease superfamily protein [Metarhizium robertsii]
MAIPYSNATWEVVDSIPLLQTVLTKLQGLPSNPPSLFVDLEGIKLGRSGSVSLLSVHVAPTAKTYIIDIFKLGEEAFTATSTSGISLKNILESENIPKVFFDIRNDSNALFSHYGIRVGGIRDLQVMEFATRRGPPARFITGLANCIKYDCPMTESQKQSWLQMKDRAGRLYDPNKGGGYEVFNERPLRREICEYSAQDVALLPKLWEAYSTKLSHSNKAFWQMMVDDATLKRIKQSQSKHYDGQAESKKFGPWTVEEVEEATKSWREGTMQGWLERRLEG